MENNTFKNLIEGIYNNNEIEFIGYGNPNAKILIIGKECAIDEERNEQRYELVIKRNKEQWSEIVKKNGTFNTSNIPSWFSSYPEERKFSPLLPFRGQIFTPERKDKDGETISGKYGTNTTWYNYQKLVDKIRIDEIDKHFSRTKDDEIDFLKYCFITEFSGVCTTYSKKTPEVAHSIKYRVDHLLNHPFFSSFPIIIIACGHYVRQYGDIINLEELFEVKWDGKTNDIAGNWYNLHTGNGKILIHTNQLSMNISEQLLDKIADECKKKYKSE